MRETERGPRGGLRRTMLAGMTALLLGFAGPVLAEAPRRGAAETSSRRPVRRRSGSPRSA